MSYIEITKNALEGIQKLKKSGDLAAVKKLNKLLGELREHPEKGTRQPEQLKYIYAGKWSRHISGKHRLIYEIHEDIVTVVVFSTFGDYAD